MALTESASSTESPSPVTEKAAEQADVSPAPPKVPQVSSSQSFLLQVDQKPDWVPDEYWDKEKKSIDVERAIKSSAKTSKDKIDSSRQITIPDQVKQEEAKDIISRAGLTMQDLNRKIAESGDIEEEDYGKLANVGVSKELARAFIEARILKSTAIARQAQELVGGKESLDAIMNWAADNLTQDEKDSHNRNLSNESTWKTTLLGLQAQFNVAVGSKGQPMFNGTSLAGTGQGGGFANVSEMNAAMRDQRYSRTLPNGMPNPKYDSSYQKLVDKRSEALYNATMKG